MKKLWFEIQQLLVLGVDLVSPHLLWILRNAVADVDEHNEIALFAILKDKPVKDGETVWGVTHEECKAIGLNLEHHFFEALNTIQGEEGMYTCIKTVVLKDLLDTVIHEACHATGMSEEEAKTVAGSHSWKIAETLDIELESFGPVLDPLFEDFHRSLLEDVEQFSEKPWKRTQCHMLDNKLSFFDSRPDRQIEIKSYRRLFELNVMGDKHWINIDDPSFRRFTLRTPASQAEEKEPITVEASVSVSTQAEPSFLPAMTHVPSTASEELDPMMFDSANDISPDDIMLDEDLDTYSELDDEDAAVIDLGQTVNWDTQLNTAKTAANTQQQAQPVATSNAPIGQPTGNASVIRQTVELVLHELFTHVFTKCGPTPKGFFTHAGAIFDPVPIGHIPHANELFKIQDCADAMGRFYPKQPVNGALRGCLTSNGIPQYKFYLNVNGQQIERSFIVQNAAKMDENGNPTEWAAKAQDGWKIAWLCPKYGTGSILARMMLKKGETLGQQQFELL